MSDTHRIYKHPRTGELTQVRADHLAAQRILEHAGYVLDTPAPTGDDTAPEAPAPTGDDTAPEAPAPTGDDTAPTGDEPAPTDDSIVEPALFAVEVMAPTITQTPPPPPEARTSSRRKKTAPPAPGVDDINQAPTTDADGTVLFNPIQQG